MEKRKFFTVVVSVVFIYLIRASALGVVRRREDVLNNATEQWNVKSFYKADFNEA